MTKAEILEFRNTAVEDFKAQLTAFGLKKGKIEDMAAGFQDGMSSMLGFLVQAGAVTFENETQESA